MSNVKEEQRANILWVGLSEKPVKEGEVFMPLSPTTTSGKIIAEIEARCSSVLFHRTNLVKMAPLNAQGKLRYPTNAECLEHYPKFIAEIASIKPSVVLLLGKQVSVCVLNQIGLTVVADSSVFNYKIVEYDGVRYTAIHHPSYISVYKRKEKELYIRAIQDLVEHCSC
ncbi:MAG: uracil-DNA glycosylase family protein [bacterium]